MAGLKRCHNEGDSQWAKRTKIQVSNSTPQAIKTTKASKVKRSILPSPEGSSMTSEADANAYSTENSSDGAQIGKARAADGIQSRPNHGPKTSKSAPEGDGFLDGIFLTEGWHRITADVLYKDHRPVRRMRSKRLSPKSGKLPNPTPIQLLAPRRSGNVYVENPTYRKTNEKNLSLNCLGLSQEE
jgi:hypothetical protein